MLVWVLVGVQAREFMKGPFLAYTKTEISVTEYILFLTEFNSFRDFL